jgi:chemotaxis methyl-accepting protein methylase
MFSILDPVRTREALDSFEKQELVLRKIQKHIEKRNLLNTSQFGFRANHSTPLQCMKLTDHVTLNFNNNMSTPAVFLDIEKAFDKTWHSGLLYKLSELEFSTFDKSH